MVIILTSSTILLYLKLVEEGAIYEKLKICSQEDFFFGKVKTLTLLPHYALDNSNIAILLMKLKKLFLLSVTLPNIICCFNILRSYR